MVYVFLVVVVYFSHNSQRQYLLKNVPQIPFISFLPFPSQLLLDYYFMGGAEIAIKYIQLTSAAWSLDHKYHLCVEHVSSNR